MAKKQALRELRIYDSGNSSMKPVLDALREYWALIHSDSAKKNAFSASREIDQMSVRVKETLSKQPWKKCSCAVCTSAGIEVIIFRGNNRNRRRGVHNLFVYGNRIKGLREN